MRHGSVPDTTIDPRGKLDTAKTRARTASEIEHVCAQAGADEVTVDQDYDEMCVTVGVSGLSTHERARLYEALRQCTAAGIAVDVYALDDGEYAVDTSEQADLLTDEELLRVMQAMPDEWEDTRNLDLSKADMDVLQPLIDKYGGLPDLLEAVENSVAEDTGRAEDARNLRYVAERRERDFHEMHPPRHVRTEETSSASAQEPDMDAVEEAKKAYVDGDIGVLELEDRLEDAIDLEHEPTAHPS